MREVEGEGWSKQPLSTGQKSQTISKLVNRNYLNTETVKSYTLCTHMSEIGLDSMAPTYLLASLCYSSGITGPEIK